VLEARVVMLHQFRADLITRLMTSRVFLQDCIDAGFKEVHSAASLAGAPAVELRKVL